jgi:Ca-activated chloride channel family protein
MAEEEKAAVTAPMAARKPMPATMRPRSSDAKRLGKDDVSAQGNMWGDEIAVPSGAGGLGLSGIGKGGGGLGHGAGSESGQGFGSGHGRLGGSQSTRAPKVRMGASTVSGKLPPEVIQRIVRQNFGRFRMCYEQGLARNPNLEGRVSVRFVIGKDGSVSNVGNGGSDLPDSGVVSCVVSAYYGLRFPQPEAGIVTVVYPIMFAPGDPGSARPDAEPEEKPRLDVSLRMNLARVGHEPQPCGPGADLPLKERIVLWRERLASGNDAGHGLNVYRGALRQCEATNWGERSLLLVQIVNQMRSIGDQVALWRALLAVSPAAADAVFRLMLLRVQTAADLRSLHEALGLERIDPQLLEALLKKAQSPRERLTLLRGAAERFSDDIELALAVLEAYEDTGDDAGGRAWARKLRRRVDASSHVRTTVGEYYLRLAGRAPGEAGQRDAEEARRTFGEIVEFAPEDPLARRRLGDLLRAHGWYAEAMRQYETLQELTPDDPSVPLFLAAAAQGMGKTEKAVRWLEKATGTAAPDAQSPVALAGRALASAFLAWSRQASAEANKKDEVERLRNRAARLASAESGQGVRVIMTWSHPELRAALWTNALGSMMPAPDNLPLLGVAQANVPIDPTPELEIRLDQEDAERARRLDLKAALTLIVGEGTADERIVTHEVGFRDAEGKSLERVRLRFEDGVLREEGES